MVTTGNNCPVLGAVDLTLACLAAALDQEEATRRHFVDAEAVHERAAARPFLARTLAEYGRWLLARGSGADRSAGETALGRARHLAEELGSGRVLQLLEGLEPGRAR